MRYEALSAPLPITILRFDSHHAPLVLYLIYVHTYVHMLNCQQTCQAGLFRFDDCRETRSRSSSFVRRHVLGLYGDTVFLHLAKTGSAPSSGVISASFAVLPVLKSDEGCGFRMT